MSNRPVHSQWEIEYFRRYFWVWFKVVLGDDIQGKVIPVSLPSF